LGSSISFLSILFNKKIGWLAVLLIQLESTTDAFYDPVLPLLALAAINENKLLWKTSLEIQKHRIALDPVEWRFELFGE
jgi:hypothetical protein